MAHQNTLLELNKITDTGLFERLATAVIRAANPKYNSIVHTGINTDGKTVKGPVDGFTLNYLTNSDNTEMIAAHHTTGARDKYLTKLLHDPTTVKRRKSDGSNDIPGDVLKTAEIYKKELQSYSNLNCTLILTFTDIPSKDVISETNKYAQSQGIVIEWWDATRIADFLDTDPTGQYIRNHYLNIKQKILSANLLKDLSINEIEKYPCKDDVKLRIDRETDSLLSKITINGPIFLSGKSGYGKSVSCHKYLQSYIDSGGYGLVVNHTTLETSSSLEELLRTTLKIINPELNENCDREALNYCDKSSPLLLIVEDINRSSQPANLIEKLLFWGRSEKDNQHNWRVVCPVWPDYLIKIDSQLLKELDNRVIEFSVFESLEAEKAVKKKFNQINKTVSEPQTKSIAKSLGYDPLLIALYLTDNSMKPVNVITTFIDNILNSLSSKGKFSAHEFYSALFKIAKIILTSKKLELKWSNLLNDSKAVDELRTLKEDGRIFKVRADDVVHFRHDRIRDSILQRFLSVELKNYNSILDILKEQYFAEIIGVSLSMDSYDNEIIDLLVEYNPISLFYALLNFEEASNDFQKYIVSSILKWSEDGVKDESKQFLRWEAANILLQTRSSHVLNIADQLSDTAQILCLQAKILNGNIDSSIIFSGKISLDRNFYMQKEVINQIISQKKNQLIKKINKCLDSSEVDIGAVRLAGYIGNENFLSNLSKAWEIEKEKNNHLVDYLWAAARCNDSSNSLLEELCKEWQELPDEDENSSSTRNDIACVLKDVFRNFPPENAFQFFFQNSLNKSLNWPVIYSLSNIDHPQVFKFLITYFEDSFNFNRIVSSHWSSFGRFKRDISVCSRSFLQEIWQDKKNENYVRKNALELWATTVSNDDIELLRQIGKSDTVFDLALKARIDRKDKTVITDWILKIKENESYWLQFAREFWLDDLSEVIEEILNSRRSTGFSKSDWIIPHIIIVKLPIKYAESLLIKHWDHVKSDHYYFQAALFLSTDNLMSLVRQEVTESIQPKELFRHLSKSFGFHTSGHPGVKNEYQILNLLPYLNYIEDLYLREIWEVCNLNGWYETRAEYFDPLMKDQSELQYINDKQTFIELDRMSSYKYILVDYWIKNFLVAGESTSDIIKIIIKWFNTKKTYTETQLKVVLSSFIQLGLRKEMKEFTCQLDSQSPIIKNYTDRMERTVLE